MTEPDKSLDQSYFDALYSRDPDPWSFATSPYEDGKYAETLSVLPRQHYAHALEVGCSIGELTWRLAPRCERLDAVDLAEAALAQARARNAGHASVHFHRMMFPHAIPAGTFDLVLLSEVLYYLSDADLELAAKLVTERVRPGGDVLLVHWLGETPDYPSTGDRASEAFMAAVRPVLTTARQLRRELYRIDLLSRPA
jgi:SAM-dependent methyltransferase